MSLSIKRNVGERIILLGPDRNPIGVLKRGNHQTFLLDLDPRYQAYREELITEGDTDEEQLERLMESWASETTKKDRQPFKGSLGGSTKDTGSTSRD